MCFRFLDNSMLRLDFAKVHQLCIYDVRSATDARNQWPIRLGMDAELSPLKYVV